MEVQAGSTISAQPVLQDGFHGVEGELLQPCQSFQGTLEGGAEVLELFIGPAEPVERRELAKGFEAYLAHFPFISGYVGRARYASGVHFQNWLTLG